MTAPEPAGGPREGSPKAFSLWLDAFRWIAAFDVLWGHVYDRYLARSLDVPAGDRSLAHMLFAFPAGFIHFAVMAFFVLSGYLVGGGLLQEVRRTNRVDVKGYLVKRLTRLWIVLLPALLLTAALDGIGLSAYPEGATTIYGQKIFSVLGAQTFLCNALFLHTTFCWEYGYNNAFWSLANEFWYYVTWLLFVFVFVRGLAFPVKVMAALSALGILVFLTSHQFDGAPIAQYMLIWLLGVYVAVARKPPLRTGLWLSAAVFLAYAVGFRLLVRHAEQLSAHVVFMTDVIMAATFANLLIAMKVRSSMRPPFGASLHKRFAGFSYSLYAVHEPILNCFIAVTMALFGLGWRMVPNGPGAWTIVLSALALAVLGAYLFSLVSEAQTARARGWVFAALAWLRPSGSSAGGAAADRGAGGFSEYRLEAVPRPADHGAIGIAGVEGSVAKLPPAG